MRFFFFFSLQFLRMQARHGKRGVYCVGGEADEEEQDQAAADLSTAIVVRSQPIAEMKTEQIFIRIQHLQQLLDRFLACRPTGNNLRLKISFSVCVCFLDKNLYKDQCYFVNR